MVAAGLHRYFAKPLGRPKRQLKKKSFPVADFASHKPDCANLRKLFRRRAALPTDVDARAPRSKPDRRQRRGHACESFTDGDNGSSHSLLESIDAIGRSTPPVVARRPMRSSRLPFARRKPTPRRYAARPRSPRASGSRTSTATVRRQAQRRRRQDSEQGNQRRAPKNRPAAQGGRSRYCKARGSFSLRLPATRRSRPAPTVR
jgi:hypothetical protein